MQQLQLTQQNLSRGGGNSIQLSVAVTKLKQQISSLQNQIAAQQAVYVKQQAAQHGGSNVGGGGGGGGGNNEFLRNQHDPINSLQGNFTDMSINKVRRTHPPSPSLKILINFFCFSFVYRINKVVFKVVQVINQD